MITINCILISFLPSFVKIWLLNRQGCSIHKSVKIRPFVKLNGEKITIGANCIIGVGCQIEAQEIDIGQGSQFAPFSKIHTGLFKTGRDCRVGTNVCVTADELNPASELRLESRCVISSHSFIDSSYGVYFETEAGIGGYACILTAMAPKGLSTLECRTRLTGKVVMGYRAWIPVHVTFLPGSGIGKFSLISSGSVAHQMLPLLSLCIGNPAKVLIKDGKFLEHSDAIARQDHLANIIVEFCKEYSATFEKFSVNRYYVFKNGIKIIIFMDNENPSEGFELFDLTRRICTPAVSVLASEMRDYLSWYGILFEPVEKIDFSTHMGLPHASHHTL